MTTTHDRTVPTVADDAWIAPGVILIGDLTIGSGASVWYGSVVRADQERIVIGEQTNIQDGTMMHSDPGFRSWWVIESRWATGRSCTGARSATTFWSAWAPLSSTVPGSAKGR